MRALIHLASVVWLLPSLGPRGRRCRAPHRL